MDADVSRTRASGRNRIEELELPLRSIDGKGTYRSLSPLADAVGFIRRIEPVAGLIDGEATGTRSQLIDTGRLHGATFAIHMEQMNPSSVPGRQINLRGQHVAKW